MSTKLVIERGTGIREVERVFTIWSGEAFLEYQKKKMFSLSPNMIISTKRGTGSLKVVEYPYVPKKMHLGGFIISTGRGTGTRLL